VFNYNLPDVPETYVHRIGRTGRAGREGVAVSFCEFGEKELLGPIEKLLKKPIPVAEEHDFPMRNFEAPKRDKHGKLVNPDDAEARQAARERKKERSAASQTGEMQKAHRVRRPIPEADRPGPKKVHDVLPGEPFGKRYLSEIEPKPRSAQTAASGKRFSSGYKPSKTLEEALHAMEPKWTEEEKQAAQPVAFNRDPLAGDVVMDATARLLAPRKGTQPRKSRLEDRKASGGDAHNREERRHKGGRRSTESKPVAGRRGTDGKKTSQALLSESRERSAPRRHGERPRRERRPMETPLRLGNQKDSTEQRGSLMKPYYFNPNGE